MDIYKKSVFTILTIFLASCGVPQEEHEKIKFENKSLKTQIGSLNKELNEFRFGEQRLIALVEKNYKEKNYIDAKLNIEKLANKHPQSKKNEEFKKILDKILEAEALIAKKQEADRKEALRIANLNNTGIWSVRYYVDDFGDPTKDAYITTKEKITGRFSNSATENSKLNVNFLISGKSRISFQLYEYAGRNPVKAYSKTTYTVLVKGHNNTRLKLTATNISERLTLKKSDSRKLHSLLMKGGDIQFKVIEDDTHLNQYNFTVKNTDWYENAYTKLKES